MNESPTFEGRLYSDAEYDVALDRIRKLEEEANNLRAGYLELCHTIMRLCYVHDLHKQPCRCWVCEKAIKPFDREGEHG